MTKISIIGAGTAVFSLSLIRDICLTPGLEGSTISFMDIDADRLRGAHALCRRYAEEAGILLQLEQTTDRRESIRGADFVILAALVGGHERFTRGWEVARRHGYRFGGSLHVMHDEGFWINYGQLSLMEEVMRDILEVSPNAWYMLVANPVMAGVTYLSRKYPQAKLAGFCHGSNGVYRIAETLGLDPAHITFEAPGVNHFIWLTEFRHKGQNAFPILDRWVEEQSARYFENCDFCDDMGPKAIDLYRKFGAFPIGDTGNPGGGAWPFWYHTDKETQLDYKEDPDDWFDRYLRNGHDRVARIGEVSADMTRRVMDEFPPKHSRESMITFIEAIACDVPRVIILNILNDGHFVPGIPPDFQVEIPCYVSAIGVEGIRTKGLSKPLIEYALRDRVAPVETELSAYEHGSYDDLVKLVLMDPWTRSERQARGMIDEMMTLPGLEAMRRHYR